MFRKLRRDLIVKTFFQRVKLSFAQAQMTGPFYPWFPRRLAGKCKRFGNYPLKTGLGKFPLEGTTRRHLSKELKALSQKPTMCLRG
jgi:hypothetical protein